MRISSVNLEHTNILYQTGGNCFVLCNSTGAIGGVVFNGVKIVVLHVALTPLVEIGRASITTN